MKNSSKDQPGHKTESREGVKGGIRIIVVLGRLGKNLVISKLAPICELDEVEKVYAFCEEEAYFVNEKLRYITLPRFIAGVKPQVLYRVVRWFYEPLQLLFHAIKIRPHFINGVYTLPKGLNSFLVSKITGIKCIISVIGGKEEIESEIRFPRIWKALNLFMLRHSYSVTCKGDRDIEYLVKQGIKKEKLYVYNGGIDIKRFCQAETQKSVDIIYAGRFNQKKGSFRLLDVIIKLLAERPALKCVFLGEGELRAGFEEKVSVLGLKNNIKCYGHIADPEVYYRQSRLFVLPSSNEGLSTAMLEAMSCGCVPVVSNVGNTSEAVKDNYNGCLIDNFEDIESFASAIATILGNVERQTEFSRNAIETVQNQYSFSVQSKFFERIIR